MPYETKYTYRFGHGTLPNGTWGYGYTYGPETTWRPADSPSRNEPASAGSALFALGTLIVLGFVLDAAGLPVGQWLDTVLSLVAEHIE